MRIGILILSLLMAAAQLSYAADAGKKKEATVGKDKAKDTFTQGQKGKAKESLEQSAGKKTSDVKVPDVPKPTPVK